MVFSPALEVRDVDGIGCPVEDHFRPLRGARKNSFGLNSQDKKECRYFFADVLV